MQVHRQFYCIFLPDVVSFSGTVHCCPLDLLCDTAANGTCLLPKGEKALKPTEVLRKDRGTATHSRALSKDNLVPIKANYVKIIRYVAQRWMISPLNQLKKFEKKLTTMVAVIII